MKKTFKVLPIMAITMAVVPLAIVASCTSEEDNYLPGPPINPVPPVNPIPPVPPVVEVKPTQATLDAAIEKAKAQYANVVLDVNNNFFTQDYNTVEKLNADETFVGMVNFNKEVVSKMTDKEILLMSTPDDLLSILAPSKKTSKKISTVKRIEIEHFSNYQATPGHYKIRIIFHEMLMIPELLTMGVDLAKPNA